MPTFSVNVTQQRECHPECPHGSSVGALSFSSTVLLQISQGNSGCCCCDMTKTEGYLLVLLGRRLVRGLIFWWVGGLVEAGAVEAD